MMLYLQDLAKQEEQTKQLIITERLPHVLLAPCVLDIVYRIEAQDDFYLIHLHVKGMIDLVCQRCMHEFHHCYDNQTLIAVCSSEKRAEALLPQYECIVSPNGRLVLEDLIIDELHLFVPQSHPNTNDCDNEIIQFLNGEKG